MNEKEVAELMFGFYAYETGSMDSGIHDDLKKAQLRDYLLGLEEVNQRVFLARLVRHEFLTEEAIKLGYGLEDVEQFIVWLNDWLGD